MFRGELRQEERSFFLMKLALSVEVQYFLSSPIMSNQFSTGSVKSMQLKL